MDECEKCSDTPTGFGVHDYCAECSRNLCTKCMAAGCCGHAPALSGMDAEEATREAGAVMDTKSILEAILQQARDAFNRPPHERLELIRGLAEDGVKQLGGKPSFEEWLVKTDGARFEVQEKRSGWVRYGRMYSQKQLQEALTLYNRTDANGMIELVIDTQDDTGRLY